MTRELPRSRIPVLVLVLATSLAAPARAGEPLEGNWETPLGLVRIEESGGRYSGKLVETSRACGYGKGSDVLRGRMSEGIFTGEVRVCFPVRCRSRDEWMLTMAAPAADGERISGAVASLDCADAVFKGRPFVLTRHHRAQPVAELAPPSEGNSRGRKMSAEAQRLFREGMEHSGQGRYDAARGKFEAAGRLDPRNADVLTQIGVTYYARGNHSEAERHYRRAVAADGSHTVAYYNLACVLAKQGKVNDALRELRKAVDTGFSSVATMDEDRDLDPLRREAAFRQIRSLAARNEAKAGH